MKDLVKVSWVFDVISPFAYLAFPQLSRLPAHVDVEFVPVLLAGLLRHFGQLGPAEIPSKRRFTYRFALWRARQLGLPMRMPPAHPFNPLAALRLIIAAGSDRRAAGTVLGAVFRQGRDVSDPAVITELARELSVADPQAAEVVKLRVFAGMTVEDIAHVQGISPRTVKRNWAYARAWLGRALADYAEPDT